MAKVASCHLIHSRISSRWKRHSQQRKKRSIKLGKEVDQQESLLQHRRDADISSPNFACEQNIEPWDLQVFGEFVLLVFDGGLDGFQKVFLRLQDGLELGDPLVTGFHTRGLAHEGKIRLLWIRGSKDKFRLVPVIRALRHTHFVHLKKRKPSMNIMKSFLSTNSTITIYGRTSIYVHSLR